MLFGWERVSPKMHYLATFLVALGTHFSAIWIVIANSWMHTPAGYKIVGEGSEAKAVVTDFWQMIFNPSAMDRLTHVVLGCWLSGIFLFISISAYYLLKKRYMLFAKTGLKIGLVAGGIVLFLQLLSADSTAKGVSVNQPVKLAAIEGVYETVPYTPMSVIGWVDSKTETVQGIKIPGLLSFLVNRNLEKPVKGLKEFPKEDWPNVAAVFQTYHLMIFMWVGMVCCVLLGLYCWKKKKLEESKWTLRVLIFSVIFPQIANQAGWFTAEMGRQPWVVQGLLRTTDAVSPTIHADQVFSSILMFLIIYIVLFALFIFLLDQKIKHGPGENAALEGSDQSEYRNFYK